MPPYVEKYEEPFGLGSILREARRAQFHGQALQVGGVQIPLENLGAPFWVSFSMEPSLAMGKIQPFLSEATRLYPLWFVDTDVDFDRKVFRVYIDPTPSSNRMRWARLSAH